MFLIIEQVAQIGKNFVNCGLFFADGFTFPQLVLLAIVFHYTAAHINEEPPRELPIAAGLAVFPLYFLHRYLSEQDDVVLLIGSLFRSLLLCKIVYSITRISLLIINTIRVMRLKFLLWLALRHGKSLQRRLSEMRANLPPAPLPLPPPPPLPRAERMRRVADAAQDDFTAEAELLATMPLDEDEREILTLQAKQRLLKKLSQLSEV